MSPRDTGDTGQAAMPLFALRINVVTNNRNSGRCTGDPLLCSLNNGRISIDFHMLTTDVFRCEASLMLGVSVRPSVTVLKSFNI